MSVYRERQAFALAEAFARAFKQRFGQTPSEFRTQPQWTSWRAAFQPISDMRTIHMKTDWADAQVSIVEADDTRVTFFPDIAEHEAATDIFLPLK